MSKKNAIKSKWILLISFLFILPVYALGQTFSQIEYTVSKKIITNPERGFYHAFDTRAGNYSPLQLDILEGYESEGVSLIYRGFNLKKFVSSDISDEYLSKMEEDFQTARKAGVKMVVIFEYTERAFDSVPYGDAKPKWVMRHINQLSEVLKANSDVIAAFQAGFIGAWGEWYYTDHFSQSPGNLNEEDWENRRMITLEMLRRFPKNRMIQLRDITYKRTILGDTTALDTSEAYSGSPKARLGHHNDCFVASPNDVGTYEDTAAEKAYLAKDTRFVVMGGETCRPYRPRCNCFTTLHEMERFHWSYINADYHPEVIDIWESEGCLDNIKRRLGYRYLLKSAQMQDAAKPNGSVHFKINLANRGFANVYNPRDVFLVLRNTSTGTVYKARSTADPRWFNLDDTTTVNFRAGLPNDIETGQYKTFLYLPDPDPKISQDPRYAIQLANNDIWEDSTGFNRLNHTLIVNDKMSLPSYKGDKYFKKITFR